MNSVEGLCYSDLPIEIQYGIIKHLDIPSWAVSKSVCKQWRAVSGVLSNHFITAELVKGHALNVKKTLVSLARVKWGCVHTYDEATMEFRSRLFSPQKCLKQAEGDLKIGIEKLVGSVERIRNCVVIYANDHTVFNKEVKRFSRFLGDFSYQVSEADIGLIRLNEIHSDAFSKLPYFSSLHEQAIAFNRIKNSLPK
ncbi:MAG: hypothetical protein K940chlam3_00732 [Chlamydiae bacterium]|nr:hypothetical protein [Chlamydiota bacterium]